jgi:DNA-binding SARP family transcriptional activator
MRTHGVGNQRPDPSHGPGFGLLGPLEVIGADGRQIALPAAKQRVVLAALLLKSGGLVSVEELIERLWFADPPDGARGTAQAYVMRVRQALGPLGELIRTVPGGYLLRTSPARVDVATFADLVRQADAAAARADRHTESVQLGRALALWRGAPLADIRSESLQLREAAELTEQRLRVWERRVHADLALGRHESLIGELYQLTRNHPLRERLWAQLLLALSRSGRRVDALVEYQILRRTLAREVGVDPCRELRDLNASILAGDPGSRRIPTATGAGSADGPPSSAPTAAYRPCTLPPDVIGFTGRVEDTALLCDRLAPSPDAAGAPAVAVSGMPGVGKTGLAVHVAHRLRASFPDGQIFLDLRGYAPEPPVAVSRALASLLALLRVPRAQVPADPQDQAALYRALLADRRVLMVLDNAKDAGQVRPLLPAGGRCAALVTSRDRLPGLAALQGAFLHTVQPLGAADARTVLTTVLTGAVTDAQVLPTLVDACAGLPLALRIAAANVLARPEAAPEYARQLRDGDRLEALRIDGEEEEAVHTSFMWSYAALTGTERRHFRRLAAIPGPDVSRRAARAAWQLDDAGTMRMLGRLCATGLLRQSDPGRYRLHDLLRCFARQQDDPRLVGVGADPAA